MRKLVISCGLAVLAMLAQAETYSCHGDPSLSCSAAPTVVDIGGVLKGTETRQLKNFFGVHALFWGVQNDLAGNTPARMSPQAVSLLSETGVGFIRYGGGVNEIDWRGCMGWVMDRPKQNMADWLPPQRCVFGIDEYEKLSDIQGYQGSWHIANIVGFERSELPIERLLTDLADRVDLVKGLAPNRHRYWELGNELERDWTKWSASKIVTRSVPAAKVIAKHDAAATIILPLLEYRPAWIANDDDHNRFLIRQHKGLVSDYALHMYYDNPPWGPSVANRLSYTRRVSALAQGEGVVNPALWITEHARPPPGTPADPGWKNNWYQTNTHDAVLATADFLIGLAQIPAAQGAAWHGLRAGPWNYLELTPQGLRATRTARLFELLHPAENMQTLTTRTRSLADSSLPGGYAIRASAFTQGLNTTVWLVNRSAGAQSLTLKHPAFKSVSNAEVQTRVLTAEQDPARSVMQNKAQTSVLTIDQGSIPLVLSPRSVTVLTFGGAQ